MVRTKADAATTRVSGAKAPRKIQVSSATTDVKKGCSSGGGGNPYCPRETPAWQKEITKFFAPATDTTQTEEASSFQPQQNKETLNGSGKLAVNENNGVLGKTSEGASKEASGKTSRAASGEASIENSGEGSD